MKPAPLLDFEGVAKLLSIHPRQAEELYRQGAFPGIRLSHKYLRFDAAEVMRSIKAKKTKVYEQWASMGRPRKAQPQPMTTP